MGSSLDDWSSFVPVNVWSVLFDILCKRTTLPIAQKEIDGNAVFRHMRDI